MFQANMILQFVKYIFNRKTRTSHILVIYNSNCKKSKHVVENNLDISKFRTYILRRHSLIPLIVPPCFISLDIILVHDDLNVSVSVVAILRTSAPTAA